MDDRHRQTTEAQRLAQRRTQHGARAEETPEQRLTRRREQDIQRRARETPEEREQRLARQREACSGSPHNAQHSLVYLRVRNYVAITLHERNLSKKRKHMAAPGPAILSHLELAVQSTKVPREPTLITEK